LICLAGDRLNLTPPEPFKESRQTSLSSNQRRSKWSST
jgi:hypothetical protein